METFGKRFDYVAYDKTAASDQSLFKDKVTEMEAMVESTIKCPRSKALAFTKLEEFYMWVGKGIRNDQIARNGSAMLQEGRTNS